MSRIARRVARLEDQTRRGTGNGWCLAFGYSDAEADAALREHERRFGPPEKVFRFVLRLGDDGDPGHGPASQVAPLT